MIMGLKNVFVGSPKSIVPQESRKLKTTQIGALKLGS